MQSGYTLPDTPREIAPENGVALAGYFGLQNATAEQLRAIPAEAFWPLGAPYKIAPTPISGDAILPEPMLDVFLPPDNTRCPL